MAHSILRLPAVKARTGLSRSSVYLKISQGIFPKPISLGARAVGWLESEVDAWLEQLINQSRRAAAQPKKGQTQ
ncbi:MAG TPA: AlpA family transcriptional regulator [Burkholderiales bacterium]|nr:AlpA family transcriptional regulator [Burkholderiales bacterium]